MNSDPAKTQSALIVLTDKEKEDFFPRQCEQDLRNLLPEAVWMEATFRDPSDWLKTLESVRPEILIAAWEAPTLPLELLRNGTSPIRYLCYLTGSVRSMVLM